MKFFLKKSFIESGFEEMDFMMILFPNAMFHARNQSIFSQLLKELKLQCSPFIAYHLGSLKYDHKFHHLLPIDHEIHRPPSLQEPLPNS